MLQARRGQSVGVVMRYARPEHKAVGRMAVHCLTLQDDLDAWHGLSLVATARLDPSERARLAWATLRSLTPEDADLVIDAVFGPPVGAPEPSFVPDMGAARIWADTAIEADLKIYITAAFEALPVADQRKFIAHVSGRAAA
jgi:hypothetical protein